LFSLSKDKSEKCKFNGPNDTNLAKTVLAITPENPIVGFHGSVNETNIVNLGIIWLDTSNSNCKQKKDLTAWSKLNNNQTPTAPSALDA
jgi:hypothetical protein